eukprot:749744-Hanusia_phi.AAC.2
MLSHRLFQLLLAQLAIVSCLCAAPAQQLVEALGRFPAFSAHLLRLDERVGLRRIGAHANSGLVRTRQRAVPGGHHASDQLASARALVVSSSLQAPRAGDQFVASKLLRLAAIACDRRLGDLSLLLNEVGEIHTEGQGGVHGGSRWCRGLRGLIFAVPSMCLRMGLYLSKS